ncbi:hypothetical protein KSC_059030 [Ktedonobacter sp. SOSP1-52]|nr:hypothetical protein KSC_059030 [Ktedonobacter sp. SOSP1-52]
MDDRVAQLALSVGSCWVTVLIEILYCWIDYCLCHTTIPDYELFAAAILRQGGVSSLHYRELKRKMQTFDRNAYIWGT